MHRSLGKICSGFSTCLLKEFGGLLALLSTDLKTFCQAQGLDEAKYAQLQAFLEMSRRYLRQSLKREGPLSNPEDAEQFLLMRMRAYF